MSRVRRALTRSAIPPITPTAMRLRPSHRDILTSALRASLVDPTRLDTLCDAHLARYRRALVLSAGGGMLWVMMLQAAVPPSSPLRDGPVALLIFVLAQLCLPWVRLRSRTPPRTIAVTTEAAFAVLAGYLLGACVVWMIDPREHVAAVLAGLLALSAVTLITTRWHVWTAITTRRAAGIDCGSPAAISPPCPWWTPRPTARATVTLPLGAQHTLG